MCSSLALTSQKLSSLSSQFLTVSLCFFSNRPFKCDKCDTYYYRKNVLKAHMAKCVGTKGTKQDSPGAPSIAEKR